MPISMRPILLRQVGSPSGFTLDGNLDKLSKTHIWFHKGLEVLSSRNPAFNIPRRNEPVAADTVLSDTPAIKYHDTDLCWKRHFCVCVCVLCVFSVCLVCVCV